MNTNSKFGPSLAFALCAAAMLPMMAIATERTWVGASGGKWTDASNWVPAGKPGKSDVLVFKPVVCEGPTPLVG